MDMGDLIGVASFDEARTPTPDRLSGRSPAPELVKCP
jgi:hypothetical protein